MGAQNVAQFQSTSKHSVTELHKEHKEHNCYRLCSPLDNSLQQPLYMQDLVLLYKEWPGSEGKMFVNAGSSPLDRIVGRRIQELIVSYTKKVISMKV